MARPALRQLSLLVALALGGCHEVLALEPPPLARSETVLLAARAPDGDFQLFADAASLPQAPSLVLGAAPEVWAFGFGCGLERLDLAGRNLRLEREGAVPPLPPPTEVLRFAGSGWAPAALGDAPPELRAPFPEDDSSPCEVYAPGLTATEQRRTALPMEASGDPFITAVPNGRGGLVVLQPVLEVNTSEPRSVRLLGARLLEITRLDANARLLPEVEGLPAAVALADRGGGELVVAGLTAAVQGNFTDGFRPLPAFPDLSGAAHVTLAVSGRDEAFEAFVLARSVHPLEVSKTATLTLYRVDARGAERLYSSTMRPVRGPLGEARPDAVARTGPGEAYALGFSAASQILRVEGGAATLETIDPQRNGAPAGLAAHPEAGVAVVDVTGRAYLRAPGGGWRSVLRREGDRGPFALTSTDGVPALLLYNPAVTDRGVDGGTRLQLARATGVACGTGGVDVRPFFHLGSGHLAAVPDPDGRAFWMATMSDDRVAYHRVSLEGPVGACGP